MRMSELLGSRYKEPPVEAILPSHGFLLRGGYIRQLANGIYSMLPPATRVARKIEAILRAEMNGLGGQEVLMPVVLPRDLWDESGRSEFLGSELLRFNDRTGHAMVLGMTHEEAAVVWGKEVLRIRDDHVLLSQEYYDQDGVLVKAMRSLEVGEMGGRTLALRMRMAKVDTEDEWTEIRTDSIEFDVDLSDNLFTRSNLRNPRD